ncbi:MAG TPA: phosphoribosylanthranilate isomerase [Polyangiaceae bacterium]
MALVKICGVTNVADAETCIAAGAESIGLNFVGSSPRVVTIEEARTITSAVRGRIRVVGVVAHLTVDAMARLRDDVGLDALQLHGDESPNDLAALLPNAYKAVRIATLADVEHARAFGGDDLLLDAKSPKGLGGTGAVMDWTLVTDIAKERKITLAGGLTPDNVQAAILIVAPRRVDVASGVEDARDPRKKDPAKVRAFVTAAG